MSYPCVEIGLLMVVVPGATLILSYFTPEFLDWLPA